jgi:hypothetical protein
MPGSRATLGALAMSLTALHAQDRPAGLRLVPPSRSIQGAGATQNFLAIATLPGGLERDVTAEAVWTVADPSRAIVSSNGELKAVADGATRLSAAWKGLSATADLRISDVARPREFSFGLDIGVILTRNGCNGASCHGGVKGRGGFKLSAGALHAKDDYQWIVKGGAYQVLTDEVKGPRTPRIDLAHPENSLILRKATGAVAHGGGRRFTSVSPDYSSILSWIRKGAPYGPEDLREERVVRLEVAPGLITLTEGATHGLIVTAHLAGGATRDFTTQALFVSNDGGVAAVNAKGIVTAGRLGETSILVRAAGLASGATVGVIGPPIAGYPSVPSSNFIDDYVLDKLRKFRVPPSPLSSDAEFIRRICLDLTGTLPPPARVREFVASRDPRKRDALIGALIGSPEFVDYWTFRFDDLFRVAIFANGIQPKWSQMYAEWVRDSIARNKPFDRMARERLVAQGYDAPTRHFLPYDVIGPPGETMAEELRVFFGRRLDCAQCHNHPYEAWTQDQFWGMAAFFGRMFKMGDTGREYVIFDHPLNEAMGNGDVNGSVKMFHPRTKAELKPVLLDGREVPSGARRSPRHELAEWVVKHPYFSESMANRMWAYFFGRGLVDPVDDFRSTNPPTHPELLDRLAREFRGHGHDIRHLIRVIVSSRTYQLSGETSPSNRSDRTNYSHSYPRPLDAEVLLDAICDVTGVPETFTTGVSDIERASGQAPYGTRAVQLREPDLFFSRFLELYGRPNRLTMPERTGGANLGQALHQAAGAVYNDKLSAPQGRLQKLISAGKTDAQIAEEFYLAAFARPPDNDELSAIADLISRRGDRQAALKDFVWAIIGSREFAENH